MKKLFPFLVVFIAQMAALLLGKTLWPDNWWATVLLALFAGVIVGFTKRIWDRRISH